MRPDPKVALVPEYSGPVILVIVALVLNAKMHLKSLATPLLLSSLPLASAQLNLWAKKAGLKYFGAATDSPGQRERAGLEDKYAQYDAIFADPDEFGQTTPTNGQKVEPRRILTAEKWLLTCCSGCLPNPSKASSTGPRAK